MTLPKESGEKSFLRIARGHWIGLTMRESVLELKSISALTWVLLYVRAHGRLLDDSHLLNKGKIAKYTQSQWRRGTHVYDVTLDSQLCSVKSMVYLQFHMSGICEKIIGVQPKNTHTFRVKPRIGPFLVGLLVQLHGKPRRLQLGSIQASGNQQQQVSELSKCFTIVSFIKFAAL